MRDPHPYLPHGWIVVSHVFALGLALCQSALAGPLSPSDIPDLTLKIAGSTIQDNNIDTLLKGSSAGAALCLPGTLSSYKDGDAAGKGTYWRAWFCRVDSALVTGLGQSNPKVLILKRNKSGAVTGTYPLLEPTKPIQFMGINNGNQCTSPDGGLNYSCTTNQPGDVYNAVPDVGMSDVDPYMFKDTNFIPQFETGGAIYREPLASDVTEKLNILNAGAVIQNTPVSLGLRNALQAAQIAEGTLTDATCVGKDTLACMPSLDSATLAKIFKGAIATWSDITVKTSEGSKPLTDYAQTPISSKLVHLCRRNLGASTQAAINAFFLRSPCEANSPMPVALSNPNYGPVVLSPGQVSLEETCLDSLDKGTVNPSFNPMGTRAWAIGMLTTERNTTLSLGYRYIKIDGAAPTPQEVFNGKYTYFTEAAYLWRKQAPTPTGDTLTLMKYLIVAAATPQMHGVINAKTVQPWGIGSFIGTTGQGYPAPTSFDPVNPVTSWTHQPKGQTLENCRRVSQQ
jgi:hypothetical protein